MREILVVDDDEGTVEIIADLLRESGFQPITATTGDEALARLERAVPDLLVVDLYMPGMDGWELLDRIGRLPAFDRVPKVAMTAWPRPVSLPAGVALVHKPFEWDAFLRLCRRQCGDGPVRCRVPVEPESSRTLQAASIR
ncbi:MAG TPA: response regulator [Polyangiaceae bacterium]|nr:response regulator [Polyangiaceae bacterium]